MSFMLDFKEKGRATVGSAPDCDIVIAGAAPQHAEIIWIENKFCFYIQAMGAGEVWVNNQKGYSSRLVDGDLLSIAGKKYTFTQDGLREVADRGGRITIQGLRKTYKYRVLNSVNLLVAPGSMVAILGPSGCGKSTLLKILRGVETPDKGPNGQISRADIEGTIGYVLQDDLHFDGLTVHQCLESSARYRATAGDAEKQVDSALADVRLVAKKHDPIQKLSGGERKRLSIALELLGQPDILVLDEPTSSLDHATQSEVIQVLRGIKSRGITVVCVTHAVSTLHDFDNIVLLRKIPEDDQDSASVVYNGSYYNLRRHLPRGDGRAYTQLFRYLAGETAQDACGFALPPVENDETEVDVPAQASSRPPSHMGDSWRNVLIGAKVTVWRTLLSLLCSNANRSRMLSVGALTLLCLPVAVGAAIYVALGGRPHDNSIALGLSLILSLLWLTMTLSVRMIVAEREICERELRAGLSPLGYICGKVVAVCVCAFIQTGLLCMAIAVVRLLPLYPPDPYSSPFDAFCLFSGISLWSTASTLWVVAFCGGLIGLVISSIPKSQSVAAQTLAVALLPLFLIPHLLFNRSVAGENSSSTMQSVYRGNANTDAYLAYRPIQNMRNFPEKLYRRFHTFSILLISRPAMNILYAVNPPGLDEEARANNQNEFAKWLPSEWAYLFALLLIHVLAILVIFYYAGPPQFIRRQY